MSDLPSDLFSLASADLISASSGPDSEWRGNVSPTSSAGESWLSTGPMSRAIPTCERSEWPTPCSGGPNGARSLSGIHGHQVDLRTAVKMQVEHNQSISSSADSPAKMSPTPASVPVWTGHDPASGGNLPDAFASFDRASSSWKMSQGCMFGGLATFSESWPRAGLMRNGRVYARPMLAHRTGESGCSSSPTEWMTPVAHDDNKSPEAHLAMKARMKGGPRKTITSLQVQVKALTDWAKPTEDGNYNRKGASATSGDGLATAVNGLPDPANHNTTGNLHAPSHRPVLNPRWVSVLMGFPVDYLDGVVPVSRRSGTRSCLNAVTSSRVE